MCHPCQYRAPQGAGLPGGVPLSKSRPGMGRAAVSSVGAGGSSSAQAARSKAGSDHGRALGASQGLGCSEGLSFRGAGPAFPPLGCVTTAASAGEEYTPARLRVTMRKGLVPRVPPQQLPGSRAGLSARSWPTPGSPPSSLTLPRVQSRAPASPPCTSHPGWPPPGPAMFISLHWQQMPTCPGTAHPRPVGLEQFGGPGQRGWRPGSGGGELRPLGPQGSKGREGPSRPDPFPGGLCHLPYAWGISKRSYPRRICNLWRRQARV